MNNSYYPPTNEGKADWWQNITETSHVLSQVGFATADITAVAFDAEWGVYLYRTARKAFDDLQQATVAWCDAYAYGDPGDPAPVPPVVAPWPTLPSDTIQPGLEKRREQWVAKAKASAAYTAAIGTQLGIEPSGTPFDPTTYKAVLLNVTSPATHTVTGKFRKAGGNIDGINLYGRKEGTMPWQMLGRFTAMPFSALVPLAGTAPEPWEFLARAVKRDVEIGLPSDVVQQIVRG